MHHQTVYYMHESKKDHSVMFFYTGDVTMSTSLALLRIKKKHFHQRQHHSLFTRLTLKSLISASSFTEEYPSKSKVRSPQSDCSFCTLSNGRWRRQVFSTMSTSLKIRNGNFIPSFKYYIICISINCSIVFVTGTKRKLILRTY